MVLRASYFSVQGQRGGCTGKKRGGVPAPHSFKSCGFCGLLLLFGFHNDDTEKSGAQGVAIVGIYPCGKASFSPPGGALKDVGVGKAKLTCYRCDGEGKTDLLPLISV